jgi:DNA-binding beta-propeller fold protein YncE
MTHRTTMACVLTLAASASAQTQFLVADRTGDRVVRFNWPSATVIDHMVATGVSTLDDPLGLALPGDGYLYVASAWNSSVIRYDAETGEPEYPAFVPSGSGGLLGAAELVFGPDGNLYVASHGNDRVLRYNGKTGAFIDTFVAEGLGGLDAPHSFAFDHEGNLIVCSQYNARLLRYRPDGTFDREIETPGVDKADLQKIIIGADGAMYIASLGTDTVVKVPPQGQAFTLVGGLDDPSGLALDSDGNLLVANWGGVGSIEKYNAYTGQFLETVMSSLYAGMSGDLGTILFVPDQGGECRPDMDGNGVLDLFDFLMFFNEFAVGC